MNLRTVEQDGVTQTVFGECFFDIKDDRGRNSSRVGSLVLGLEAPVQEHRFGDWGTFLNLGSFRFILQRDPPPVPLPPYSSPMVCSVPKDHITP